jgi:DNA-binding GntR family transcriptional regulator
MSGDKVSTPSGHTALAARPTAYPTHSLVADLLHRFELWTVLECHAVSRAALAAHRDMGAVRAAFPELNQQLVPTVPAEWQRLELRLHRTITDQAGNPLLADMVERICSEFQAMCAPHVPRPIRRPGTLWLLQCQHRKILSCIEAGQAEEGMLHTRAHLHLIRDQWLAALSAPPPV